MQWIGLLGAERLPFREQGSGSAFADHFATCIVRTLEVPPCGRFFCAPPHQQPKLSFRRLWLRYSCEPEQAAAYCSVKKVSRTLPFSPIRQTNRFGLSV